MSGYSITVPVMDARRGQVYSCIYENSGGKINKLTPYLAEDLDIILEIVKKFSSGKTVAFMGD